MKHVRRQYLTISFYILPVSKQSGVYVMKKIKQRVVWGFNPVSRVVQSKKRYNRKKLKQQLKKEVF